MRVTLLSILTPIAFCNEVAGRVTNADRHGCSQNERVPNGISVSWPGLMGFFRTFHVDGGDFADPHAEASNPRPTAKHTAVKKMRKRIVIANAKMTCARPGTLHGGRAPGIPCECSCG